MENTSNTLSFLITLQTPALKFYFKRETLGGFLWILQNSKNIFFTEVEYLWATASEPLTDFVKKASLKMFD